MHSYIQLTVVTICSFFEQKKKTVLLLSPGWWIKYRLERDSISLETKLSSVLNWHDFIEIIVTFSTIPLFNYIHHILINGCRLAYDCHRIANFILMLQNYESILFCHLINFQVLKFYSVNCDKGKGTTLTPQIQSP